MHTGAPAIGGVQREKPDELQAQLWGNLAPPQPLRHREAGLPPGQPPNSPAPLPGVPDLYCQGQTQRVGTLSHPKMLQPFQLLFVKSLLNIYFKERGRFQEEHGVPWGCAHQPSSFFRASGCKQHTTESGVGAPSLLGWQWSDGDMGEGSLTHPSIHSNYSLCRERPLILFPPSCGSPQILRVQVPPRLAPHTVGQTCGTQSS